MAQMHASTPPPSNNSTYWKGMRWKGKRTEKHQTGQFTESDLPTIQRELQSYPNRGARSTSRCLQIDMEKLPSFIRKREKSYSDRRKIVNRGRTTLQAQHLKLKDWPDELYNNQPNVV
jgi:hypothetical protein